jgi:YidC/Oxa1 family membrane protein insertase
MDQKNFIVAIVLSVLIIVGWQAAFPPAKPPVNGTTQQQTATTQPGAPGSPGAPQAPTGQPAAPGVQPGAPAGTAAVAQVVSRKEALARSPRVTFDTPELIDSIALKGARIDNVQLAKYRVTIDPKSDPVPCCRRSAASIPTTPNSAGRRTPPSRRRVPTRCGRPTRLPWRPASRCGSPGTTARD